MDFEHIFYGLWAAGCYLFGVWWGTRKERKRVENPNTHKDCLKALALVRMNYDKENGMYSKWIYESLTYAIERISKIDHINTYIGNERIPPFDDSEG